jgi:hypothetical protein
MATLLKKLDQLIAKDHQKERSKRLSRLKNNKAPGPDNIPAKALRKLL